MNKNRLNIAAQKLGLTNKDLEPFYSLSDFELFNLLKNKFQLNETRLLKETADNNNCFFKNISELIIQEDFKDKFENSQLIEKRFIPIFIDNSTVGIATDNPYNPYLNSNELKIIKNKKLVLFLISSSDFNNFFVKKDTPINKNIPILENLLQTAIEKNASDIHIHEEKSEIFIGLRINGTLYPLETLKISKKEQLGNLIKIHSHMDISIFNQPQDGHISFSYQNQKYNFRVSSLPTVYGEDFVLRLFNSDHMMQSIEKLGFTENYLKSILQMLNQENGLILVTGPTGSGKTTTLYSFLNYLYKTKNKNIISIEDPVEYLLAGIRQSQINPQIDFNFVQGLKAILRQDPDIIMIGEIRDKETAKIVLNAAYTGHLVLSSLHTSNVKSSFMRLASFDLDSFLLSHTLKGIISQKLIPKLCPQCKTSTGCLTCNFTGSSERIVLAELLEIINPSYQTNIFENFQNLTSQNNFIPFSEDIKNKLTLGMVSAEHC